MPLPFEPQRVRATSATAGGKRESEFTQTAEEAKKDAAKKANRISVNLPKSRVKKGTLGSSSGLAKVQFDQLK